MSMKSFLDIVQFNTMVKAVVLHGVLPHYCFVPGITSAVRAENLGANGYLRVLHDGGQCNSRPVRELPICIK